tara:strand:+ start:567 stop:1145 length:579 start_codon:yes stop_codon:yes gene_type:complete
MAGLLENEEAQAIAQAEQMPVEQQPAPENSEGDDFNDPALQRAIAYMGDRLYGKDKVAEDIAQNLGQSETPLPKMIATIAYTLSQAADEATDGMIREENLSILGMLALNEVFTVAEQAGMPLETKDVSSAMKQMVIMYGEDNGLSEEEIEVLAGGMMQVDDAQFAQAALELPDEFGDSIPEEFEEDLEQMEA